MSKPKQKSITESFKKEMESQRNEFEKAGDLKNANTMYEHLLNSGLIQKRGYNLKSPTEKYLYRLPPHNS